MTAQTNISFCFCPAERSKKMAAQKGESLRNARKKFPDRFSTALGTSVMTSLILNPSRHFRGNNC